MGNIDLYKPRFVVSFKTYMPRKDIIHGMPRPHSKRFEYRPIPKNCMKSKKVKIYDWGK